MNKSHLSLMALATFLSIFIVLSFALPAKTEIGDQNAKFTQVTYSARIPEDTKDTWTFVVYNTNCSENDQGAARFFFVFYADKELWLNEQNSTQPTTWNCSKGSSVVRRYNIRGWQVTRPVAHDLQVELYWFSDGTAHLEDTTSFSIAVTVHIPLQHVIATGYLIAYLIACFVLFSIDYVLGLED